MKLHSEVVGQVRLGLEEMWSELAGLDRHGVGGMLFHHVRQATRSVRTSPVTFLLTVVTIAVSLSILGAVLLLLQNVNASLAATAREVSLSIYLREETDSDAVAALHAELRARPGVERVVLKSKQEALAEFREALGPESGLLEGLEQSNPLPASLEVALRTGERSAFVALADQFRANPVVEQVQFNEGLLGQIGSLIETIRIFGMVSICIVVVMSASIIASAIKLALYAKRDEVEIMHLVGANPGFIRAPYLVEGMFQGAAGSILALAIVYGLFSLVESTAHASTVLRLLMPHLRFLHAGSCALVLLVGVIVGLGGSYAALRRFRVD